MCASRAARPMEELCSMAPYSDAGGAAAYTRASGGRSPPRSNGRASPAVTIMITLKRRLAVADSPAGTSPLDLPDLRNVYGFEEAKYVLEIAAAGGHRLHFIGSGRQGIEALTVCLATLLPDPPLMSGACIVESPAAADMEVPVEHWQAGRPGAQIESTATVRARVDVARRRQRQRQELENARLASSDLERVAQLDFESKLTLQQTIQAQALSSRQVLQATRIARSIADLRASDTIAKIDLLVALIYIPGLRRWTCD